MFNPHKDVRVLCFQIGESAFEDWDTIAFLLEAEDLVFEDFEFLLEVGDLVFELLLLISIEKNLSCCS